MVSEQLQKKIDSSIKLLKAYNDPDNPVEIAYSGGKDSDVILQLAKEAGINFRAIYKNTTIDPPGTIKHVKDMGVEMIRPKKSFFKIVSEMSAPNRFARFCCRYLKEYKVLDKVIIGVRKSESAKRNKRYNEPTECRWFGAKKPENHVEQIYPILDWTDDDVKNFILDRKIQCAPVYYRGGQFDVSQRLGCMCCPLASTKKRINQFKERPKMVKAYLRAQKKFFDTHPNSKTNQYFGGDVYKWFIRDVFYNSHKEFEGAIGKTMFGNDEINYKAFLEQQFGIDLTLK